VFLEVPVLKGLRRQSFGHGDEAGWNIGYTGAIPAEYHNSCYQISTVFVKENVEVIEGEEDSSGTAGR
jgi:hypothetical protein